jgi:glycosyltransferase involved in cell wall biosynthesis
MALNSGSFPSPGRENSVPISIGFDAKRAFFNKSGLGNYSRSLLASLLKEYPENSYYLFSPKIKNRIIVESDEMFTLIEPELKIFKLLGPLWRLKFMSAEIKRSNLDIFHGLSQELPFGVGKTGVKTVVTVHDLIFLRFPRFYNWIDSRIYYQKLMHACRVSDLIIAVSQQTKEDLVRFLNVSPDKISVIYQGCSSGFWKKYSKELHDEIKEKHHMPERYLLYVGTVEERKNLLGLVKAIDIADIKIPLVVIGRKSESYYKKVTDYIASHKLKNILFPNHILNNELPVIYQDAECFIYPSFFEGFGIPILEALVSETPVITSKGGCFAEAAGPGSIYVDPYSPVNIGDAILEVINNRSLRDKMVSTGTDYAANFRDDMIASSYMKLYQSLL